MDHRERYQKIEILEGSQVGECSDGDVNAKDDEMGSASPLSSSPPNDFDVNFEAQYAPIFDENDQSNQGDQVSSSLASSLSMSSNRDYATSPVRLTANSCRLIRCPVCEKPIRTFYCAKCIQRGQFVTIETQIPSNVLDLQRPTKSIEQNQSPHVEETDENSPHNQRRFHEGMLQIKYRTLAKKTEALKSLYNERKLKLEKTKALLKETKQQLELEKRSNRSKEGKIELIKRYIVSREASVKKRQDAENLLLEDSKQYVSKRVYQLMTDVFPIEQVNLLEQNDSFVNMETSPLLTFSDGSHHQIEQQTVFSIVEPWLPSDGDYSAYSLWLNDNKDHIPASMNDLVERNPAYRISAALSYTTQLVNNLAYYMDVILPTKMELNTFSREMMDDTRFTYNVAKLNTNILHLCVSQGIDISLLNPQRTLKNLMLLFNMNICDLGRTPIIELDNEEVVSKIETRLSNDLTLVQESFYDFSKFTDEDDDVSDSEWEISDNINPMEMQLATEQSIQQNSYISRLPLRLLSSFWSTGS